MQPELYGLHTLLRYRAQTSSLSATMAAGLLLTSLSPIRPSHRPLRSLILLVSFSMQAYGFIDRLTARFLRNFAPSTSSHSGSPWRLLARSQSCLMTTQRQPFLFRHSLFHRSRIRESSDLAFASITSSQPYFVVPDQKTTDGFDFYRPSRSQHSIADYS